MKTLVSTLFLLIVLTLQGCIQAPSNTRKSSLASSATTTATGTTTAAVDGDLFWYTTTKITGTITINKNSEDVVYLRGKQVQDFLISKDLSGVEYYRKQYCLVGNFTAPATYKQMRLRAIPISTTTAGKTERLLRVDVPSTSENTSVCNNTTVDTIIPGNAAFSLPQICTNCTGQITTTNLNLYEAKSSPASLTKILTTKISLSAALIRVDLQSNATDSSSSCTNASCGAKGFDCCISGQCVKDASEKTNASTDPLYAQEYAQAKADYAINPLSFINYPNIFYICANIAHTPPVATGTTTTPTPISTAQDRVDKYLADYTCISEATALTSSYDNCRSTTTTIDKKEGAYLAIKKKLAIACGCTAIESEMSLKCPDWGIVPVYKTGTTPPNSIITDFNCYTPVPPNPIGPITNLNVSVSNRSSPHRFYSTAGVNKDDLSGLLIKTPDLTQEGEDFYYIDEYNKVGPVNGSYNINSILGKMTVDLSHTVPAKLVTVELGKTYILSATSGYFTPCTQCAKDSWFQNFSAHPNSQRGVGLQASGYTTSRDSYASNTTFGNYEDTKFGRACYVPVTMLPLSHQKNLNLQAQRQNRLKTQSAYYVNGYQRDWYGFNKGALIGSFDGVTWFAVGTGRRATATSTKLFLALNSSFLDLADRTDTIVNIIPDFSANTAADYDYDPEISLMDPRQNTAATCQKYHQCSVDADCVSQLGWEYTCADVSQLKTKWPLYDSEGNETTNQEKTASVFEILQGTISTTNGKRCVYRGAGAPCKRDITSLNEYTKKNLTCAPNFYCASLGSNKFNDELVRSPNEFDGILFGMDTNVLGRPLNYVTAGKSLSTEIVSNIKYNATSAVGLSGSDGDDMGICRPGRSLSSNEIIAHSNPDNVKRTDYISQIGSCDSFSKTEARFVSCPAFDADLNYVEPSNTDKIVLRQTQNSCGGEAKHTLNTGISAFKNIEGLSLLNLQNITQPIVAQDACLRRAGSVCHTDLDCGPNKLHEEAVGTIDLKYFGETDAEQQYWKESLVCGQGTPVPVLGTAGYFDYKLSENRCCREIGKDFTMYTQGPKSIVPDNTGTNEKLKTAKFPYYDPAHNSEANDVNGPAAKYRYSRYAVSKIGKETITKIPNVSATASAEPASNQWQVIHETGALTCCGGGWIRKFADGTHDWKVKNRLTVESSNFACLNFRSPLADSAYSSFTADNVVAASYQREFEFFCKAPDGAGCLQIPFQESSSYTILAPRAYDPSLKVKPDSGYTGSPGYFSIPPASHTRLDTSPTADPIDGSDPWTQLTSTDVPYSPLPYYFSPSNLDTDFKTKKAYTFFTNKTTDFGVEFYLPAYIGWDHNIGNFTGTPSTARANPTYISGVYIKYFYDAPLLPQVLDITNNVAPAAECDEVVNNPGAYATPIQAITTDNTWCIVSNANTQNRPIFNVKADTSLPGPGENKWKYAGVIVDFKPIEQVRLLADPLAKVAEPGNALYYLTKLGRLELIGIPQITYEPLYCNNNQSNLVPGIFKSNIATRAQFVASSVGYTGQDPIDRYNDEATTGSYDSTAGYGNAEKKFTFQDKLDHAAVFSSKDFTCCTPLGKTTSSAAKCCSGFAKTSTDGKTMTCKLPVGTDLNVYFNKFVSGEGIGADLPDGGLVVSGTDAEIDFNKYTGEPKLKGTTYNKLAALGGLFCVNAKIGTGGAFGAFPPEPFSGSYSVQSGATGTLEDSFPLSIVDSVLDFQNSDPDVGKQPFDNGFKWNHHVYCK